MVHAVRSTRFASLFGLAAAFTMMYADPASASPEVKLRGGGSIAFGGDAGTTFSLEGTASHLGRYSAFGEIGFPRGSAIGSGPVVFRASNGDLLVGIATWEFAEDGAGSVGFSWRDSVALANGSVVEATGRFVDRRPAGATTKIKSISDGTSNIIAILIGL